VIAQTNAQSRELSIFLDAAVYAQSWPERSPRATNQIFGQMIRDIQAGSIRPSRALSRAEQRMTQAIQEVLR